MATKPVSVHEAKTHLSRLLAKSKGVIPDDFDELGPELRKAFGLD
jgi:hypothetical protein